MVEISLYFHYPFCESKCPYCDFNSNVRDNLDDNKWQNAYLKEIDYYNNYLQNKIIKTIYFGGGTPSLMNLKTLEAILNKLSKDYKIAKNCEITIEANPASSEIKKFKNFKTLGINRISIGIQSFDENRLKFLGRKHDKNQAISAIHYAQKIFDNYSFDLIYATKNQTLNDWEKELDFALKFKPPHISLYQLTIEKGTDFYSQTKKGEIKTTQDEMAEKLYFQTQNTLEKNGIFRYEVSNFARRGFESKHNLNYWNYGEYLGIGAGAHSRINLDLPQPNNKFTPRTAIYDIHNPENWLKTTLKENVGIQKKIELTQQQMLEEMLYMGLRIKNGIKLKNFKAILGKDFSEIFDKKTLQFLENQNLIKLSKTKLKATKNGIMLHSAITKKIINSSKLI